ncbi:bacterio-opsin activator domain-containing protein [Salinigranum halophilum]|uniref:bacterio-opsin activator domain-containing protein n=1 Tax=Salinigranum halophilum TaxID=2565931 RepID=UPI0010A902F7|nr:bacterio-opsin activator domain-containing protein [Salinigranum halophilum]
MEVASTIPEQESVEIELSVLDESCFFVAASARAGCVFELEDVVHKTDGKLIEFFTVREAEPDVVVETAVESPGLTEARVVSHDEETALLQFVVDGPCIVSTLADVGAITQSAIAAHGEARVVATVPPHVDVRTVVERFVARHPGSELVARRQNNQAVFQTQRTYRADLLDRLTDRQQETLKTAFLSGYFDWPRESSAADCAAALDISQPTFSQHLRAAQQRLAAALFDEVSKS